MPLVVRIPYGGGVRALEHHSESREAIYAHIPGVKVVVPSAPRNARALLVAAIRDPDPVVFLEPKRSYRAFREEVPEEEEVLPHRQGAGRAGGRRPDRRRLGRDDARRRCRRSRRSQKQRGAAIEVIDLLTISPMDVETIVESVRKTGRCVVVQEAPRSFGVAAEIIARINDQALL